MGAPCRKKKWRGPCERRIALLPSSRSGEFFQSPVEKTVDGGGKRLRPVGHHNEIKQLKKHGDEGRRSCRRSTSRNTRVSTVLRRRDPCLIARNNPTELVSTGGRRSVAPVLYLCVLSSQGRCICSNPPPPQTPIL